MKKTLAFVTCLLLLLALAVPVACADGPEEGYQLVEAWYEDLPVATFCVPADWEEFDLQVFVPEDMPLLVAVLTYGDTVLTAQRNTPATYEVIGIPMPADLEEYSQRSGPQGMLLEGESWSYDEHGNLFLQRVSEEEGAQLVRFWVLKQARDAMGSILLTAPADTALDLAYLAANSFFPDAVYVRVEAEYEGEPVATLCIPADWEELVQVLRPEEAPVPQTSAAVVGEDFFYVVNRLGPEAYAAAGVPMPADVEEYAQRSGPQGMLLEGEEYAYDARGNLCVIREIELDGVPYLWCSCLKQGTDAMGMVVVQVPAEWELNLPYLLANTHLA